MTFAATGPATVSGNTLTITGAGPVVVTANQAGNNNYNAAAAISKTITVNKAAPVNNLQASVPTAVPNAPVTFTASLAGNQGTTVPTGTVTFLDGSTTLVSSVALVKSAATCSTAKLTLGNHTITARYAGGVNYLTVTSAAVTVTVAAM